MTDYRAIWDYDAQPKENVEACNLCGNSDFAVSMASLAKDRYGFPQQYAWCQGCDLQFLSPRMTREAYARFYETAYRPLVSAFHGREINAQTIQPEQEEYALRLVDILNPWLQTRGDIDPPKTLLDIGGSTGVVADTVRNWAAANIAQVTVLDPSSAELAEAKSRGIEVVSGAIETTALPTRRFDIITLCQTADHLLDLMVGLRMIKAHLSPGGLFWSDIVDFDVTREVKIDHPFNLTEATYRKFLLKAGFSLLQVNYAPDGKHIGFLCKAAA